MDWFDFGESSSCESFESISCLAPDWDVIQQPTEWTIDENKIFKSALAEFNPESPCFYENVASRVPWMSIDEIKKHYQMMIEDVVDSDPVPVYQNGDQEKPREHNMQEEIVMMESSSAPPLEVKKNTGQQRQRGTPWTLEEHQLFLMGPNKFGKGDWKSISKFYVITKTPTQVASHAQKYFRRQSSSTPIERRRPSIHDIQSIKPLTSMTNHNYNIIPGNEDILVPFPSPNYGLINPINYTCPVMNNSMMNQAPEAYPLMNQNQNQVPEGHPLMNQNENEDYGTYPLIKQNECFGAYPLQNKNQFSGAFSTLNQNQDQVIEGYPIMNQNEGLGTYPLNKQNEGFGTYPQLNGNQFSSACSTLNQNQNQVNEAYPLINQNDGFGTFPLINQNECFGTYPLLNQNQFSSACSMLNQNQGSEAYSISSGFENFGNNSEDQNNRILSMNSELPVVNNQEQNQTCDAYMTYMLPFNGNNQHG